MDVTRWLRTHWDRASGWGCVGAGSLFLLLGWLGASDEVVAAAQLPYVLSGGIGGLFLLGLGAVLLLSADLRDEWRKLDRIETILDAAFSSGDQRPAQVTDPTSAGADPVNGLSRDESPTPRRRLHRRLSVEAEAR